MLAANPSYFGLFRRSQIPFIVSHIALVTVCDSEDDSTGELVVVYMVVLVTVIAVVLYRSRLCCASTEPTITIS